MSSAGPHFHFFVSLGFYMGRQSLSGKGQEAATSVLFLADIAKQLSYPFLLDPDPDPEHFNNHDWAWHNSEGSLGPRRAIV